ncbi:hypothetical protein [Naasia aerilata]
MASAVEVWESLFRAQVAVMRRLVAEFPGRSRSTSTTSSST